MTATVAATRRRRAVWVTVCLVLLGLVGALGVAGLATDQVVRQRYDARIERFDDPFVDVPEETRPAPEVDGEARNFLLLGSDSRVSAGDPSQWSVGAQRTDAIMLVHLPADRSGLYVVSLPRDTWVPVPDHGEAKINAAFSFGGPGLMVRTVEDLTGLRVDHVGIVDFEGFVEMTDALGGVEITVPETTRDRRNVYLEGTYTMDGAYALDYVRQRYGLDEGDFDRVRRHQNWIRSVLREALSRDVLTNPAVLDRFLVATTSAVSLDEGFDVGELRGLAMQLRGLRGDDLHLLTVPTSGTGRSADGQSTVVLDEQGADELWASMREGTVERWLADHRDLTLGERVD